MYAHAELGSSPVRRTNLLRWVIPRDLSARASMRVLPHVLFASGNHVTPDTWEWIEEGEGLYKGRFNVRYKGLLEESVADRRVLQLHLLMEHQDHYQVAVRCEDAAVLIHVDDFAPRVTGVFVKADNAATREELLHTFKTTGIYAPYVPLIQTPLFDIKKGVQSRIK